MYTAHFLTCYISLPVYRLLEKKLGEGFTCSQILETLHGMNMTLLSKNSGYIPSYKRTLLTDALHDVFGFRTDYEFISKSSMRNIIKETKSKKSTKAYKKEKYSKKLVTASTNEATGIPSTFAQPTSTTENSHHSSPKGQL